MIELSLVGCGDVVLDRHAPILRNLSDRLIVTHAVTQSEHRRVMLEEILGYRVQQVGSVLDLKDCQSALIAVPPARTPEIVTILARRNVAQYIEMPFSGTTIGALKTYEILQSAGRKVVIGENFRRQERFTRALRPDDRIASIDIRDYIRTGMRLNRRTYHDLFQEQIIHHLSVLQSLAGKLRQISESRYFSTPFGEVADIAAESASGVSVRLQVNMIETWSEDRYMIKLESGEHVAIKHDYQPETKMYNDQIERWSPSTDRVEFDEVKSADSGMTYLWNDFLYSLERGGAFDPEDVLSAVNDVQARDAINECRRSGRRVDLASLFNDAL